MSLVRLDIDASQLHQLAADIGATQKLAQLALNSSLPKMAAWLRGKSVPGLAKAVNVPQRVIRRRLKTFRLTKGPDGSTITVWYGLDAVGMIYLQAKQNGAGVRAYGGRFVKSGFIAGGKDSRQVFKRRGKSRLPIDKQTAAIDSPAENYIEDSLLGSAEFEARFLKVFEHELTWRMQTQK